MDALELIFIVIPLGALAALLFCIFDPQNKKDEEREQRRKQRREKLQLIDKEEYEKTLTELTSRYGECSLNENLGHWNELRMATRVLVFEKAGIIVIKTKEYKFSDILGYSLVDDTTNETSTYSEGSATSSTGSMLGRAVVGGVLAGGLGAVAGAVTGKKDSSGESFSQTTTTHRYTLYINVNSIQEPTIELSVGRGSQRAHRLAGVLNVIMERNKQPME